MMAVWGCRRRSRGCSEWSIRSRWRRWAARPAGRWRRRGRTVAGWGVWAAGTGGRAWSRVGVGAVVGDVAAPVPVLAAGGIADGRGLAAALALGATGALVGTRFLATAESLADPEAKKAIIAGSGQDTERSRVLD